MRIKLLIVTIVVLFSAGIALAIFVVKNKDVSNVDLVAINDLAKTAEKNGGGINEQTISDISQPFSILDYNGKVIYQTSDNHFTNIFESIKNRDIVIDLQRNDNIVGKLIIHNDEQEIVQQMKREIITSVILILAVLMVISLFYLLFIYRTLLRPFQQLQHFAANVARGNFDVPLNMGKNNYFGAFTESFDLLREELNAARQREYETNRSKKELIATLSHDIKTPVASIKAVSELMLIQAGGDKVKKQVNTILAKTEQIDLLVTDMFHATLEELQQLKISITEVSSEVLVTMIENVNYDQQIAYDPIPPCIISMDPVRIQQVIDNIISNAYKYAGTRITIKSQINQGYLSLYIMDYGTGIREDELPLLFHKYYRGGNVEGKSGSGLGLYISKYFIEKMHGQICCYNRQDGFTIALKLRLAGN
ncbi:HAMP domain-containing sensor histidine kinase [Niallia circulans]|uniref:HAMP domain-containing sensor histidine kinase n=1 Tax=Niallia circulans TaxID=1397 RepID=UPI003524DF53